MVGLWGIEVMGYPESEESLSAKDYPKKMVWEINT